LGRVKAPWAFRKGRKNERHGAYRGRWYYQVIQGDMYVIHEGEYFLLMKCCGNFGIRKIVILSWLVVSTLLVVTVLFSLPLLSYVC